jgi:hypothetical protein
MDGKVIEIETRVALDALIDITPLSTLTPNPLLADNPPSASDTAQIQCKSAV